MTDLPEPCFRPGSKAGFAAQDPTDVNGSQMFFCKKEKKKKAERVYFFRGTGQRAVRGAIGNL